MTYGPDGQRVVVTELGETPMEAFAEYVRIEAQTPPDPDTLAPTDVVVAVRSAGVNWVDLIMTSGQYQHVPEPPYTPGLEYAGEVVFTGADVTQVAVGDRVASDGLKTGPRSLGPYRLWGGWASYAVAPEDGLVPLPAALNFDQGATVLAAYSTAYHALVHRGRLQAGETVLIHGASGTTGLAAVQVAKALGATVIATSRSAKKLAIVKAQGADHVIETADGKFKGEVKALTDGKGVHVVHDGVGGPISTESLRCVRFGARFLVVGWAATPFVARGKGQRGAPNANVLPTNLIMMKSVDVLGCPAAISAHRDPSLVKARADAISSWIDDGAIVPHVSGRYALADIHDAMRAKWNSEHVGACVVYMP